MSLNWLKKKDESASTGIFKQLKKGLSKTRQILSTDIDQLFAGSKKIDEGMLEELEALLITSDIGVRTTMELIERISIKSNQISDADELKKELKSEIKTFLMANPPPGKNIEGLRVIMVVGVNGVGKTTTIGKIAAKYTARGKKVLIVAADTFRAAATEQMMIWAERAGAEIVVRKAKTDPAAVVYDGVETAVSKKVDIVLIDTAGRLHTKINLMEELKKINRTISKKLTDAPQEILLVLDATTGQNALSQAKLFNDALGITGIALTKLDGTAKGGIVVGICRTLQIPLRYIGIGEKIDDLQDFDPALFTEALF
ncbi:MAG: signal recognition particle-docking protein FtsY [Desulfobacterales bacterium]|jgi:fused signal recognition particle receptor|nr:signal recognition particle-docking protein FtsY [Desulfobacter sp.]MDP6394328.1 signal recognition particle-docking protein FtsY [Desulfobacterales bacterium]MDP6682355.1 signal recognition particle-docking protein FtsY [Desulfobacterales bacterium]MDP6807597.1 signal recognition particle-docking protein FtsY [Desulfobacterales bacterium]|tara:strand:- start:36238 stop:37179 length:942 start_codon:yes stop_codon:yes gene_type:complete